MYNEKYVSSDGNKVTEKTPFAMWEEIMYELELHIINNDLHGGDKVPTIQEVCMLFECGHSTALKVLNMLTEEDTLYKAHGKGFYVKDDSVVNKLKEKHYNTIKREILKYIIKGKKEEIDMQQLISEAMEKADYSK